jgi:hypothetical protein
MLLEDFASDVPISRWFTIDNPDKLNLARFLSLWDESDVFFKSSSTWTVPLPSQNTMFISFPVKKQRQSDKSKIQDIVSKIITDSFVNPKKVLFSYLFAEYQLSKPDYNRILYLFVAVFDPTKLENQK